MYYLYTYLYILLFKSKILKFPTIHPLEEAWFSFVVVASNIYDNEWQFLEANPIVFYYCVDFVEMVKYNFLCISSGCWWMIRNQLKFCFQFFLLLLFILMRFILSTIIYAGAAWWRLIPMTIQKIAHNKHWGEIWTSFLCFFIEFNYLFLFGFCFCLFLM